MKQILSALFVILLSCAAASGKPPNVLFILVDDLGWSDIGAFGSSFYETPHIDRMAAEGLRFSDGYAAGSVCSPSRVAIMTGKHPARIQTTDFFGAMPPEQWRQRKNTQLLPAPIKEQMELSEVTLAEAFREGGYRTFFAGKWHCGTRPYWPQHQGFEVNKGGWTKGGPYGGKKYFSPYGNPMLENGPAGEHLPDRLASETIDFIEAHQAEPFFAYLSFYSVHVPLISRKDLKQKYVKKRDAMQLQAEWARETSYQGVDDAFTHTTQHHPVYGGMVEAMDLAVGRVLAALERLDLSEDTIVVFTSDNGGFSTHQDRSRPPTSNQPLRAGKGWLYEGGIRVPTIMRWPKVIEPGAVSATPITGTDFYPTLLDAAGLDLRPEQHRDGVSLLPVLKGGELEREAIFWHYPHYSPQGGFPGGVVRDGDWKLIARYEGGFELYNLKHDIGEQNNLADERPEIRDALVGKLCQWRQSVGALMPAPNPDFKDPSQQ